MCRPTRFIGAITIAIFIFTIASNANAHSVGISRGDYRLSGSDIRMNLVFARPELAASVQGLHTDHDGTISSSELSTGRAAIEAFFIRGIDVHVPAGACAGRIEKVELAEEDGLSIQAAYHCTGESDVAIGLEFLSALSTGHRHLTTVRGASASEHGVVYAGNAVFVMPLHGGTEAKLSVAGTMWPLFCLGIEHILTGYDHLIFLLGLILVGGRTRQLLLVITAFTVAHSITLGLAALQIWSPAARLVEPAIALSIAYVGVENWFVRDASRRWMITFPFGLIHGFGFAGALRQIALPHSEIPLALLKPASCRFWPLCCH
jgi:hydrogenase/urease accessory protein HupE